jgi:hypothetical protein
MTVPYSSVALLDVLGYKQRLERDRQYNKQDFKEALTKALNVFSEVNETQQKFEAISDTIIVTCVNENDFLGFLNCLKKVQISFLEQGLLIRGGVAYQRHFKSSNITYSHALPLAYELEKTTAVYPRIVVDSNLITAQLEKGNREILAGSNILCRCNNTYFLNIIDDSTCDVIYSSAKSIYEECRMEIAGKESEFLKHVWFERYILTSPFAAARSLAPYIGEIEFNPNL